MEKRMRFYWILLIFSTITVNVLGDLQCYVCENCEEVGDTTNVQTCSSEATSSPAPNNNSTTSSPAPNNNSTTSSPNPNNNSTTSSPNPNNNSTTSSPNPNNNSTTSSPNPNNNSTTSSPNPNNNSTTSSPNPNNNSTNTNPNDPNNNSTNTNPNDPNNNSTNTNPNDPSSNSTNTNPNDPSSNSTNTNPSSNSTNSSSTLTLFDLNDNLLYEDKTVLFPRFPRSLRQADNNRYFCYVVNRQGGGKNRGCIKATSEEDACNQLNNSTIGKCENKSKNICAENKCNGSNVIYLSTITLLVALLCNYLLK